jgi:hypothetical protein
MHLDRWYMIFMRRNGCHLNTMRLDGAGDHAFSNSFPKEFSDM